MNQIKNEFKPDWATHPGEHILEIICMSWASKLEIDADKLWSLILGIEPVTRETAEKLQKNLCGSADFWMRLQKNYDEWYDRTNRPAQRVHPGRIILREIDYWQDKKAGTSAPE